MKVLRREWVLLLVLVVLGAGIGLVLNEYFKRGTVLFALGVCLAAALRAVLPETAVGVLRVRSRAVDVLTLAALGGATLALAIAVPAPSL